LDLARFINVLKRIPLFEGLEPDQAKLILQICEQRSLQPRDRLCSQGDSSDGLFVLVSGRASVLSSTGVQIAVIEPIAPIGEMGMFTGEPRSATVVAKEPSNLLVLGKLKLDSILGRNPKLELCVSRNLVRILSSRLRSANAELAHVQGLLSDQDSAEPGDTGEEGTDP
jgi:CRP-like cAMP-binding protein